MLDRGPERLLHKHMKVMKRGGTHDAVQVAAIRYVSQGLEQPLAELHGRLAGMRRRAVEDPHDFASDIRPLLGPAEAEELLVLLGGGAGAEHVHELAFEGLGDGAEDRHAEALVVAVVHVRVVLLRPGLALDEEAVAPIGDKKELETVSDYRDALRRLVLVDDWDLALHQVGQQFGEAPPLRIEMGLALDVGAVHGLAGLPADLVRLIERLQRVERDFAVVNCVDHDEPLT